MKESSNEIKSLIEDIEKLSSMLKESYVFDEEEPMMDYEEDGIEDEVNHIGVADDKINQIRALALEGIQEFAEEVDSEEYNIFKTIWMSCDKFYSAKNKEMEGK